MTPPHPADPTVPGLPMPEWSRPGETWRIEEEGPVQWTTEVTGRCFEPRCERPAIAGIVRRGEVASAWCGESLRRQGIWVEDGRVVSWRLSK